MINATDSSNREIAEWLEVADAVDLCPGRLLKDVPKSAIDVDFELVQPLLDLYSHSHTDLSSIQTKRIVFECWPEWPAWNVPTVQSLQSWPFSTTRSCFDFSKDHRSLELTIYAIRSQRPWFIEQRYLLIRNSAGENHTPMNGRPVGSPRNVANAEPSNRQITLAEIADLGDHHRNDEGFDFLRPSRAWDQGLESLGLTSHFHDSMVGRMSTKDDRGMPYRLVAQASSNAILPLHRQGEIMAVRPFRNGPWQYQIPYDFAPGTSPFAGLPSLTLLNPSNILKEQAT